MEVALQTLVYATFLPNWLKNGSFSRSEVIQVMQETIAAVMNRYRDKVSMWNVVNEAHLSGQAARTDFFTQTIGPEYVRLAFQAAREADPSAFLYYNDNGTAAVGGPKYAQAKQIVDTLHSDGLIDGIGVQTHIRGMTSTTTITINSEGQTYDVSQKGLIQALTSFGIPAYLSEIDVDMRNVPPSNPERLNLQAELYRMVMQAGLEAGVMTVCGMGDKYSWLEQPQSNGIWTSSPDAIPTAFDDDLNPKPAYYAMVDVLKNAQTADDYSTVFEPGYSPLHSCLSGKSNVFVLARK
jgi:endo-1,4-beta-xylanase